LRLRPSPAKTRGVAGEVTEQALGKLGGNKKPKK
jgi:hypothetical protein